MRASLALPIVSLALGVHLAHAEEAASPASRMLEQIEAASSEAPILVLDADAERVLERPPRPAPPPPPRQEGVSRTITLEPPPPVTNRSSQFQFRDLTARAAADGRERTMAERRAAVEAIRQSIAQERAGGR